MADSTLTYDLTSWPLDPMDAQHPFSLETGFLGDEEQLRHQFSVPEGFDAILSPGQGVEQPSAKTDVFYEPMAHYAAPDADKFPLFTDFYHLPKDAFSLDGLLRSTSQMATERALYMNTQQQMSSPLLDPGSSPDTSSGSEDDWERHAQAMPPMACCDDDSEASMTPLEMPDGSLRFTSNWLPVDPEGGFTIGSPEAPSSVGAPTDAHNWFDLEFMNYRKEAFISTDAGV